MQDIVVPSFTAQCGYKTRLSATDMVLACVAVLEAVVSRVLLPVQYFNSARLPVLTVVLWDNCCNVWLLVLLVKYHGYNCY